MKVKVLSTPGKASALPGVFSLGIQSPDAHAVINCLPDSCKILHSDSESQVSTHLLLNDISPLNTCGFGELAELIEKSAIIPEIICPPSLEKWTKALLFEHDYKSRKLSELKTSSSTGDLLLESRFFKIRKIEPDTDFCRTIIRIESESPLRIFFIELGSVDAEVPSTLEKADIIFMNLSEFPSGISSSKLFSEKNMQDILAHKLAASEIRTALLPSSSGITVLKPADDPAFRKIMKECKIKCANVELLVVHENSFESIKAKSAPLISVSPDKGAGEFLLGFDLTAALCVRKKSSPLSNPPSFPVIGGCSYQVAATVIDFSYQTDKNPSPLHFYMCPLMKKALEHMARAVCGTGRKSSKHLQTIAIQENEAVKLLGEYSLELESVDKNGTTHLIKLRELKSADTIVYAPEETALLKSRPQFLNGVTILLVYSPAADLEGLKKIQETFRIPKMAVLSHKGTHMYDLEKA